VAQSAILGDPAERENGFHLAKTVPLCSSSVSLAAVPNEPRSATSSEPACRMTKIVPGSCPPSSNIRAGLRFTLKMRIEQIRVSLPVRFYVWPDNDYERGRIDVRHFDFPTNCLVSSACGRFLPRALIFCTLSFIKP
jgi:hypothetical protein